MDNQIIKKLDTFFGQFPSKKHKKGDVIIQANVQPPGIFYIEDGIIRRYYLSEEGTEITLNLYKPHTFLPMSWAIAEIPNTHFYEAMTDAQTILAPKQIVLEFLKREPDIIYDLLRRIYIGMEGLWMHRGYLTAGNSYTKLVASLVILAKRFGKTTGKETIIEPIMSEQDLANYAGMTRETVSRELQKLKKEGLVSFEKGTILMHDIHKLDRALLGVE